MNAELDYSVIVPVFRGRDTLDDLCRRLIEFFSERQATFEVLFVDDGSRDGSWDRVVALARSDERVRGIRLTRNFGQHNATICGFRHARGALIVTLDEDLQNPPEELDKIIECQKRQNADVVYGIPIARHDSWWRRLGSRLVMLVPRYVMKIDFDISAFRLVRAPIAREVSTSLRHDIIIDVYFAWITDRIAATKVRQEPNTSRRSSYTFFKLIHVLFNLLYNYTVLPLRISIVIGIGLSVFSLLLAAYYVYMRMVHDITPGFAATIVSILFTSGVILLGVGMVSEYLAHTFLHVIRKPQSVVRETTDREERIAHEGRADP